MTQHLSVFNMMLTMHCTGIKLVVEIHQKNGALSGKTGGNPPNPSILKTARHPALVKDPHETK
jgi:hypothetical protein